MANPSIIPNETLTKAINALLKWIHSNNKKNPNKSQPQSQSIYLILSLKKTPHRGRSLSVPIPLPHTLFHPINLIFDDGLHSPHSLSSLQATVTSLSLPISSLVPFSDVRSYRAPPPGLAFVDRRVAKLMPAGGKATEVAEIDLRRKAWPAEVRRKVSCTVLNFRGGTCIGIRVGNAGMAGKVVAENAAAAVEGAVANVPKKWGNVRGLHLKAAESLALPIYGEAVDGEGGQTKKRKGEGGEEEKQRKAKKSKVGA